MGRSLMTRSSCGHAADASRIAVIPDQMSRAPPALISHRLSHQPGTRTFPIIQGAGAPPPEA